MHPVLQVTVDGPSRTTVNPAGMKQGAACFQYVAMHPGVYTVAATIDGRHITNSPATVTASIAKPAAPNCEVRCPTHHPAAAPNPTHRPLCCSEPRTIVPAQTLIVVHQISSRFLFAVQPTTAARRVQVLTNTQDLVLQAGKELQILFVAKDKQGIRKSVGGDIFNVFCQPTANKSASTSVARITDLGTGEYNALFNETAAGAYSVSILYEDRHIAGSPLTVQVTPAELEPVKTNATGTGLSECVARRATTVQILAKDLYGNPVVEQLKMGAGEIEAVLRGPETIELAPTKVEAGCLTLQYTCMKAGVYDLSLTHAGWHLAGSPWKVRAMPGPAVAAMCSVEGLPSSVVAGQTFSFSLQTLDECKNATVTTNSVTCEVDSPTDGTVPLMVSEQGQGAFRAASLDAPPAGHACRKKRSE